MKSKNPFADVSEEEIREIGFYWLQKAYMVELEKTALLEILKDRGIKVCLKEMHDRMNRIQQETCQES